MPNCFARSN
ncbi:hypothetical protein D030_1650A, partial [Vibrio parahaemolyticus AQ3810]